MRGPVARRFGHGAAHLLVGGGAYWPEPPKQRPLWRDVATALGVGVVFVLALAPLLSRDRDAQHTRIAMLESPGPVEPVIEPEPEPIPEPPPLAEPEPPPPPPPPPKPVAKPPPPKVTPPPVKLPPRPKPELARVPAPPPPVAPRPEPVRTARLDTPRPTPVLPRLAPAPIAPVAREPARSERGTAPRAEPARARVPVPVPAAIDAVPDDDRVADSPPSRVEPRARAPLPTSAARPMPKALAAAPVDVADTTYTLTTTARAPVTAPAPTARTTSTPSRKPVSFAATSAAAPSSRAATPRSTRTGEPEAPEHTETASRRRSSDGVRGVPLGELRVCRTDREEDALKLRLLGAVTQPGECSSSAGWYRLVETKNLNSFLMWIERASGRVEADRCDELRHALACFAGKARAGGAR